MNFLTIFLLIIAIGLATYMVFVYKNIKDKDGSTKWYHHVIVGISSIGLMFYMMLISANVLFSVEDYFATYSYKFTFVSAILLFITVFIMILFYVSAIDENRIKKNESKESNEVNKLESTNI